MKKGIFSNLCSLLEMWMTGEPLKQGKFLKNIKGKLCVDKGYIGQTLFENLSLMVYSWSLKLKTI